MESRQLTAEKELSELLDQLFASVRVFQAGGQEATEGNNLADRVNHAAKSSAIRRYSQFDVADHDKWRKVLAEARTGNLEALKQVGHIQDRTNGVWGTIVSVRVDLGGSRVIKKKKTE